MMMIFHSGVSKRFWIDAFATATFLINHLLITTLDLQSHFSILYRTFLDYHSLHFLVPNFIHLGQRKINLTPNLTMCFFGML